jgi:uncharacterized protein YcaQ
VNRPLRVSPADARRFLRRAHGFDARLPGTAAALERHAYVQLDPLNVCGRMQDHILRNRVAGYREGDLTRHLHGGGGGGLCARDRAAFEHHLPSTHVLAAFPLEAWPHLQGAMRARERRPGAWMGRLTPREREMSERILAALEAGGPIGPEDIEDSRKGRRVWGAASLAKATMQKLFFHGRILIAGRQANRRVYDLPGRVLPARTLAAPPSAPAEAARWAAACRLRQHRLAVLRREEAALVGDIAVQVHVEGCPALHCLAEDLGLFEGAGEGGADPPQTLLLAPLDPVIYDRRLTRLLWGFDYAWEAYVPERRRKRGYYALPVLAANELVGHVDLKADRARGTLEVVSRAVGRGHRTAPAVGELARFLGLRAARP